MKTLSKQLKKLIGINLSPQNFSHFPKQTKLLHNALELIGKVIDSEETQNIKFSETTLEAVKTFQKESEIQVNGIVDNATLVKLATKVVEIEFQSREGHPIISFTNSNLQKILPDTLRFLVIDSIEGRLVQGVPLALEIIISRIKKENIQNSTSDNRQRFHYFDTEKYPLDILSSNHVGYASFKIPPELNTKFQTQFSEIHNDPYEKVFPTLIKINIKPFLKDELAIDITEKIGKTEEKGKIDIQVEAEKYGKLKRYDLLSIQEPDVLDYKLSPSSFGFNNIPVLGADGCEKLLPTNLPERITKYHQLQVIPGSEKTDHSLTYKLGKLVEYETVWKPINHGLGKVLYSLPLAPLEHVNIAVIDWSREDELDRDENSKVTEQLVHEQRRDRVIEETVEASIKEFQGGDSFIGGTGGVGGYGQGSWGVTGSHSVGYATTASSGKRDVEADTIQTITDNITQASNAARDFRSTVIVQAAQSEYEKLQTRTIRNHNHQHSLTILYYEIVRNYLIKTRLKREKSIIFIKQSNENFNWNKAIKNKTTLVNNLLDSNYLNVFNHNKSLDNFSEIDFFENAVCNNLILQIKTSKSGQDANRWDRFAFHLITKSGNSINFKIKKSPIFNFTNVELFRNNSSQVLLLEKDMTGETTSEIKIKDIDKIAIAFNSEQGLNNWLVSEVKIDFFANFNDTWQTINVVNLSDEVFFNEDSSIAWEVKMPDFSKIKEERKEKAEKIDKFIKHLNNNKSYYNSLIWFNENPVERAIRFEQYPFSHEGKEGKLIDFINNKPLGVYGSYLAFELGNFKDVDEYPIIEPVEKIIALPTRGAFAEAQLSHCPAAEIIDETRREANHIDIAPEIGTLTLGSRYQGFNTQPTIPGSSIGIEDPTNLPQPSGLSSILDLLGKSEIFRDMSGSEQLGPLLQKLAEVAGEVESKRLQQAGETERLKQQLDAEKEKKNKNNINNTGSDTSSSAKKKMGNLNTLKNAKSMYDNGQISGDAFEKVTKGITNEIQSDSSDSILGNESLDKYIETVGNFGGDISYSDNNEKLDYSSNSIVPYSDNINYHIAFCANDKEPFGHSFITWYLLDNVKGISHHQGTWGLYPKTDAKGVISFFIGNVPGEIRDDSLKERDFVFDLQVPKEDYFKGIRIKNKWAGKPEYELKESDCLTFLIEVANIFKEAIKIPKREGIYNFPIEYLKKLIRENKDIIA